MHLVSEYLLSHVTLLVRTESIIRTAGNLLPVEVSMPSLLGDDDEESQSQQRPRQSEPESLDAVSGHGKGKRKAPPE